MLEDFVDRVDAAASAAGGSSEALPGEANRTADDEGGFAVLPVLLVGAAVGDGVYLINRRRTEQTALRATLNADQEDLRAEVSVLADDVMRLEDDVTIHPDALDDYEAGVARYRWAQAAIDGIDSPGDIPRVRRPWPRPPTPWLGPRAVVRGDEPPPPPADLARKGSNGEPAVELDDDRRPVYAGYGGGWGGGGFLVGNGLFIGLLLGQLLGGGFGWGGGGDWGGGDFGRGDVGGGDW